LKIWK